jgi:hypothetical protein
MTPAEINELERLLDRLEQSIVEAGMPKTHLHNVRDLRGKTLSHFMFKPINKRRIK